MRTQKQRRRDDDALAEAVAEVVVERMKQDAQCGPPSPGLSPLVMLAVLAEEVGEVAREIIAGIDALPPAEAHRCLPYRTLAVMCAAAEAKARRVMGSRSFSQAGAHLPAVALTRAARREVVQVAAVATKWVQAMDALAPGHQERPPPHPQGETAVSRTITLHGASDDLVEIAGAPGADNQNGNNPDAEDGEWNVDANPYGGAWDIVSEAEGQRLRVHAIYDGCWSFAVAMADEDERFPAWPCTVRLSAETTYSTELVIEAPDDAHIVAVGR